VTASILPELRAFKKTPPPPDFPLSFFPIICSRSRSFFSFLGSTLVLFHAVMPSWDSTTREGLLSPPCFLPPPPARRVCKSFFRRADHVTLLDRQILCSSPLLFFIFLFWLTQKSPIPSSSPVSFYPSSPDTIKRMFDFGFKEKISDLP